MHTRTRSVTGIMRAVDTAAAYLPDLTVIFVSHCDGAAWLADPTTDTVYIDGTTNPDRAGLAITDALDALCHARGVPAPLHTRRPLRLIHSSDEATGT
jgi:hypothetical protein